MSQINSDITVVGGGISGLIAALVFAKEGHDVLCIDQAPPRDDATSKDLRSTAFLMPSIRLLEEAGIFDGLKELAAPLVTMRIVDAGGVEHSIRETVDFEAHDAGEDQFGWNIPNANLIAALLAQISKVPNLTMRHSDAVVTRTSRLNESILRLESGDSVRTKLVVAADGRNSTLRETAGIEVTRTRYHQKAIVFAVTHDMPHKGISTEVHRTGGPFTLVPLTGDAQNQSAVVWMDQNEAVDALMALDDTAFEHALNLRSCGVMGHLTLTSKRGAWPIISQYADGLIANRLALIGEAAHVVPPIGAQGLNMSLTDIATLRDLLRDTANNDDIGAPKMLEAYEKARWREMRTRVQGVDVLNRTSMVQAQPLRDLRQSALKILGTTPIIKRTAIKTGLGMGR